MAAETGGVILPLHVLHHLAQSLILGIVHHLSVPGACVRERGERLCVCSRGGERMVEEEVDEGKVKGR